MIRHARTTFAAAVLAAAVLPSTASAIEGGHPSAAPYSFMGSLQRLDVPRDDLHACGVSLIAPRWATTAGHCTRSAADVIDRPTTGRPAGWKVRFGSTRVDSGGQLVDVERFVQRNNRYFHHDLALLRLAEPVRGAPIEIADATPTAGTPVRIMGWGQTCDGAAPPRCSPDALQEADTQLQPQATCKPEDKDLCVGPLDGSVGPLNLDSGGPAVVLQDGRWRLIGSVEGAGNSAPSIYTNVVSNRAWIDGFISGRRPIPADTPFPSKAVSGTVQLGGCTGSIVRPQRPRPSDRALLLTNGHCVQPRPAKGAATVDRASRETALIKDGTGTTVVRAKTTRVLYATMNGTDAALLRLDATYADLARAHVRTFALATHGPHPGQRLRVLSGTSGEDWTCRVQAIVPGLREGGYRQTDAIRYRSDRGCSARLGDGPGHGDSGSPLVDPRTGAIVGLHATGSDEGLRCKENNPCEIDDRGRTTARRGARYGQQTAGIARCLSPRGRIALTSQGCTIRGRGA